MCARRCLVRRHRSACLMRSFRSYQLRCLTTSIRLKTLKLKLPRHDEKRCLETSILHALKMEKSSKPSPKIIIETMLATGMTQAEAAEHFNVSTRWIRTLQARYRDGGIKALEPRSKRPRTNPRALDPSTVDRILQLRQDLTKRGTDAGAHTIRWHLQQDGIVKRPGFSSYLS